MWRLGTLKSRSHHDGDLVRALFLACCLLFAHSHYRERKPWHLSLKGLLIHYQNSILMNSSKLSYMPKVSVPDIIILGVRASVYLRRKIVRNNYIIPSYKLRGISMLMYIFSFSSRIVYLFLYFKITTDWET